MYSLPPMVDMRRSPAEKQADCAMPCSPSDYPWGLSISLDDESLKKLKADFESIEIGETYHFFMMAKVTAKSRNENEGGEPRERIELQITHMAAESEDKENRAEMMSEKLYKKK